MKRLTLRLRFLLLYLTLGILPMLLSAALFFSSASRMSAADAKELYAVELEQVVFYVESHMKDMMTTVIRYVTNARFVSYLSTGRRYDTLMDSVEAYLYFLCPLIDTEFLGGDSTRHLKVYYLNERLLQGYNVFTYATEEVRALESYRRAVGAAPDTDAWYFDPENAIVSVNRAIRGGNVRLYGVFSVYESASEFEKLFDAMDEEVADLYLVDESGNIIASNHPGLIGRAVSPTFLGAPPARGGVSQREYAGEALDEGAVSSSAVPMQRDTVMCYRMAEGFPDWRIVMSVPTGRAQGKNLSLMMRSIYISLAIGLFSALVMSYAISCHMRRLSLMANAMRASGDELNKVDCVIPRRRDEFDEIILAYNGLIDRVSALITENYQTRLAQKEAELYALQSQVNPHFIYNLLEQIRMRLILSNDDTSARMVLLLSRLLRNSLNWKDTFITLGEEARFIKDYLELQSMRYNGRLIYEIDIPDALSDARLPRFSLQPLVENSAKHGFASLSDAGHIWVRARLFEGDIAITVSDDSKAKTVEVARDINYMLSSGEGSKAGGVGIANVNMRIRMHYGAPYGIRAAQPFDEVNGTGWRVEVILPYKSDARAGEEKSHV